MPFEYDEPDFDKFLRILCGDSEPTFQTFPERKGIEGYPRVLHGNTPMNRKLLSDLNAKGHGCFVMVNEGNGVVREGAKSCRSTHNVVKVRSVFVDLDGAPLQPVLDAGLKPHIIIESSPGKYHVYWMVSDCTFDQFTQIQKAIAARFDGDVSVNDLPRVMRLPGFLHQKQAPFMTRILEVN